MNLTEILTDVYHLHFPTQRKLASTFLRFQEHYESPQFKGKIFSLDEFKRWYIANSENGRKTGRFTYHQDWTGFNVPSYVLEPFYQGLFDPLSKQEESFLDNFENKRRTKFYLIGTFGDHEALEHEIAHGLFYTDGEYKKKVLGILASMKPEDRSKIRNLLMNNGGYHKDVLDDEMHACLATDPEYFTRRSLKSRNIPKVHRQLRKVFDKHLGKHTKK